MDPLPRLVLAPGLRAVPRGREHVQIGLRGRTRVLRRTAAVDAALEVVSTGGRPPDDPEVRATLQELAAAGVLVDLTALDGTGRSPDAAALATQAPAGCGERWAVRGRTRVAVSGTLGIDPLPLLTAAGVRRGSGPPDVALVLAVGEPDRESLSPLLRDDVPHVVVRLVDGVGLLGPFVVPGRTACLHCLDLHADDDAPGTALLIDRYARAGARPRPDGVPEPVDTVLATLLTAWAVRELLTYVDGGTPATWSSTLRLAPDLTMVESWRWRRHPQCGCAWL
jgi:hypothetical protein